MCSQTDPMRASEVLGLQTPPVIIYTYDETVPSCSFVWCNECIESDYINDVSCSMRKKRKPSMRCSTPKKRKTCPRPRRSCKPKPICRRKPVCRRKRNLCARRKPRASPKVC